MHGLVFGTYSPYWSTSPIEQHQLMGFLCCVRMRQQFAPDIQTKHSSNTASQRSIVYMLRFGTWLLEGRIQSVFKLKSYESCTYRLDEWLREFRHFLWSPVKMVSRTNEYKADAFPRRCTSLRHEQVFGRWCGRIHCECTDNWESFYTLLMRVCRQAYPEECGPFLFTPSMPSYGLRFVHCWFIKSIIVVFYSPPSARIGDSCSQKLYR